MCSKYNIHTRFQRLNMKKKCKISQFSLWLHVTVPCCLRRKWASRICKFFKPSKEDIFQYFVRKPLNKKGKKPRTKAPKIQQLVTPQVLQHKCRCIALKKQHTEKNKKEATEYDELLFRRIKEAKEEHQNKFPRQWGCPFWELPPLNLVQSKWDFLRVTNKTRY